MIHKKYFYSTTHYDASFAMNGRHTHYNHYEFDSLADCINSHRETKKHDFDYGDATYETSRIYHRFVYMPDVQRPHARSKYEWEDLCDKKYRNEHFGFDQTEFEFMQKLFIDITENDIDNDDVLV